MVCLPKPLIVMATIVDQNRLFEVKLSHRECFLQKKISRATPDLLYGGAASPAQSLFYSISRS
jgi:hypothetical protein